MSFIDSTTFNDPITSYSWSFGDGGISNQSNPIHQYAGPGIYDVTLSIQTISGCPDTFSKKNAIKIVLSPQTTIVGDTLICVNSQKVHSGIFLQPDTSIVTWKWNFPNGDTSTRQNPYAELYNTVGNFTIQAIATNSSGCTDTTLQNITVNPLPTVTIPKQVTIGNGVAENIPATYSPNTISWIWKPSVGLSCYDCPSPDASPKYKTLYQVSFKDSNGCGNSGFVEVIVLCQNSTLFIPNTFSPNGDGANDVFYPRGTGLDKVKLLRILNRWGEVVYEKKDFQVNDPLAGWNGTYKGNKPQADVYIYQAEVFCDNGELITLNGNIALIL